MSTEGVANRTMSPSSSPVNLDNTTLQGATTPSSSATAEPFYITGAVIVSCNLFVLLVLCFKSAHHPVKRLYLINLSGADILLGAAVLVRALLSGVDGCSEVYPLVCYLRLIIIEVSYCVSMSLLTALTLLIHAKVSRPLSAPYWINQTSRHKLIITAIWMISLALSVSICISQIDFGPAADAKNSSDTVTSQPPPNDLKSTECLFISVYKPVVNLITCGIFFILPAVVVVTCQCHILIIARRHTRRISVTTATTRQEPVIARQLKSAITVAVMSAAFVLCWTPFFALIVYSEVVGAPVAIEGPRKDWITLIWYLNSLLNPIIYSWRLPEFRDNVRKLMCRGSCCARWHRVAPEQGWSWRLEVLSYLETWKKSSSGCVVRNQQDSSGAAARMERKGSKQMQQVDTSSVDPGTVNIGMVTHVG